MVDKLVYITVKGVQYPLAYTINVIEAIENEYGSRSKWAKALMSKEPLMKDLIITYKEFINEGIEIENEVKGEKRPLLEHKQVGRLLTSIVAEGKDMLNNLTEVIQSNSPNKNPNV